jgi:hypothetical protein
MRTFPYKNLYSEMGRDLDYSHFTDSPQAPSVHFTTKINHAITSLHDNHRFPLSVGEFSREKSLFALTNEVESPEGDKLFTERSKSVSLLITWLFHGVNYELLNKHKTHRRL